MTAEMTEASLAPATARAIEAAGLDVRRRGARGAGGACRGLQVRGRRDVGGDRGGAHADRGRGGARGRAWRPGCRWRSRCSTCSATTSRGSPGRRADGGAGRPGRRGLDGAWHRAGRGRGAGPAGDAVLRVSGDAVAVLGAERTMLNFLTHLSGIATATRAWADAVAGTGAVVRDTRKTLPGLRVLEKYAVRCGGGENHRMGLGDAALVKDNHVAAAGGVAAAVRAVRARGPPWAGDRGRVRLRGAGTRGARGGGASFILLDNMAVPRAARGGGGGARLLRGAA